MPGDSFYDEVIGTEEADDLLFALQVQYGRPEYGYDDFIEMQLTPDELYRAQLYVQTHNLSKFNYFSARMTA